MLPIQENIFAKNIDKSYCLRYHWSVMFKLMCIHVTVKNELVKNGYVSQLSNNFFSNRKHWELTKSCLLYVKVWYSCKNIHLLLFYNRCKGWPNQHMYWFYAIYTVWKKNTCKQFYGGKKSLPKKKIYIFGNLLPFATVNKLACLILVRSIKKTNHTYKTTIRWVFVAWLI